MSFNDRVMPREYCGKSSYYIIITSSRNNAVTFLKWFASLEMSYDLSIPKMSTIYQNSQK